MSKKVALITGIAGQDGPYLAEVLLRQGYQVIGLVRDKSNLGGLPAAQLVDKITVIAGPHLDRSFLAKVVKQYQPTEIYNLAAQSSVAQSWAAPEETMSINTLLPLELLEIIRTTNPTIRFFQASSAEIYGEARGLITEKTKFNPLNPYAISKLAAHYAVVRYRENYGLFACNGILFSHTSPRQVKNTVAKNITQSAAKIERGLADMMVVGNLAIKRDWTYAGDVAQAMWLMLQQKKPQDCIVASGKSFSVAEFAKTALATVGIKQWKKYVTVNQTLIRKSDIMDMVGSNRQLKKMGWKPKYNFKQLVTMLVDYERQQLKK